MNKHFQKPKQNAGDAAGTFFLTKGNVQYFKDHGAVVSHKNGVWTVWVLDNRWGMRVTRTHVQWGWADCTEIEQCPISELKNPEVLWEYLLFYDTEKQVAERVEHPTG